MLANIITGIISVGIDSVVTQVVRATAPEIATAGSKVLTKIGSLAISYALGKKVTEYIAEDVESLATGIETISNQAKQKPIEVEATVAGE